jgi:hypothetical protein
MGRVYLDEDDPPDDPSGPRVQMHVDMDRVPVVGESIEIVSTGVHTALRVTRVVWMQGDGAFMPVVKCVRDE